MKLHTRLLLSYIILIAITLGVIGVTLVVFLGTRPAPPQSTFQDLGYTAQGHLRQFLRPRPGLARQLASPEGIMEQLSEFSEASGIRTLLVEVESGGIGFDSNDEFEAGTPINWQLSAGEGPSLPPGLRFAGENERRTIATGSFRNPDGEEWLFVGIGFTRPNQNQEEVALVYALPRPTQSLVGALNQFAEAIAPPIMQAAFTGIVIAVFMAVIVSRTIARPLFYISDGARAVAAGDFDQQVPVTGPPEVRTVAESFNYMTQAVKSAQTVQHDFMVNVSHDLKTPLTSIQGYSQAIMDGASMDPVQSATVIHEEAARLNRMVAEITDLARLQDGRVALKMVDLDLSQIVSAIGQRLAIVAEKKAIDLHVDADPLPPIQGDGDRLAQVVTNLISNALKYTPREGKVRVKTQVNNGGVEMTVTDNGLGIPADDLPRIFERFYQVEKARSPRRGTGLGLAITREIVQAHGGSISATSAGPDQGSTFTIWLPCEQVKTVVAGKKA